MTAPTTQEMRLVARAMLRAQWGAEDVTYVGLFTPFVIAAAAKNGRRVATFEEIKATLADEFAFDMPDSVIRTVLKQAIRQEYGAWEKVSTARRPDAFRLNPSKSLPDLDRRRADAEREQSALVASLCTFANTEIDVALDAAQAVSMLADFIVGLGLGLPRFG